MENNLKLVCPKCGTPHQPHSPHTMDADGFERCEIRTVMEDRGWCYECSFWQNMYDKHKDDPGWVRIDGESWVLKPMVENVPSGWNSLGCGGRKMYINIEGKGIVVSNNCWCQGDVSDAFKDLMPDNATWATKEEFGKWKNRIKYNMFGVSYYAVFYSFEDAYEFNYGEKEEGKVKVVDSCYKRRW